MSLAKQGRIQEAIALCEEAGKTDTSVRPALVATMALVSGRPTAQDLAAAEPYLKKALEAHKDQPALLVERGDYSRDARKVCRGHRRSTGRSWRSNRQNVEVLNNLATLLAEQPEPENHKEALEFVEQAIKLAGPQPGLLDTKGMALFFGGKPDQAVDLLQQAAQIAGARSPLLLPPGGGLRRTGAVRQGPGGPPAGPRRRPGPPIAHQDRPATAGRPGEETRKTVTQDRFLTCPHNRKETYDQETILVRSQPGGGAWP